jgi:hypothetical protein
MPTLHIEHPITDFDTRATTFDRFATTRRDAGIQTERGPRPVDRPSYLAIDLAFDARDDADVGLIPATSHELVVTPDHDSHLVADVVAQWAKAHSQPVPLTLRVPAGGTYARGRNGGTVRVDAVEFSRVLSGRGRSSGLLNQQAPVR